MKKNRLTSFLIIFLVYLITIIAGVIIYLNLSFSYWLNLFITDFICTVIIFIFSLIFKNASVYDPYWSVQPIVIVIVCAIINKINYINIFAFIAVIIWGIRLTINWGVTFKSLLHQDWRYTMLKEKNPKLYPIINFIGIHLIPTIVVYLCILPVVFMFKEEISFNFGIIIAFIISLSAVVLQGTADIQMHRFQKKKTGTLIREGLWKYSRHPNYLGEILMWWGIALNAVSALGIQNYYFLFLGAICNTCLFLFISIPLAENHQKKRKERFDEYKKQTWMLLPIKK